MQRPVSVALVSLAVLTCGFSDVAANADTALVPTALVPTALADAAESEDWSRVALLLAPDGDAKDLNLDVAQADGMTALHWAVHHNHGPSVDRLLAAGCDANVMTRYDVTPLSIACVNGSSDLVRRLLESGATANVAAPGGETPLMTAAAIGDVASIGYLTKHGAAVDAAERKGQTAIMWAAANGHVGAVEALLAAGADGEVATRGGFTAMLFAAREGRIGVVKRLLEEGIDVNAVIASKATGKRVPRKGTSALLLAIESGHFELAMVLVQSGADPNDQRSGLAPLHAIVTVRKPNRGEEPDGDPPPRGSGGLTSDMFVREIVSAGADVNLRLAKGKHGKAVLNKKGATPLLLAAKTADLPLIQLLIELGADPTIPNSEGCTPLMAAAGVGVRAVGEEAGSEPEVIATLRFLLAQGLDINAIDNNQETAMHGAAYRCYPRVVEFLAAHGADPLIWNHKNESGWTPFAIGEGHRPGSFKPSPETIAALAAAFEPTTNGRKARDNDGPNAGFLQRHAPNAENQKPEKRSP